MSDVTRLLHALRTGDGDASDELIEAVYGELRRLAASKIARERGQTLQATALVHEAWMRITGRDEDGEHVLDFQNRAHFLGAAAEAMRRILIERARKRRSLRHGGAFGRADIEPDELVVLPDNVDVLELDEALGRLKEISPERARIVELRFFGGLSIVEAAEVLGVSRATADRAWAFARAWLFKELGAIPAAENQDPLSARPNADSDADADELGA
ncbi:ECF sigma factor [Planctomycetes bacterium Poly30]|uniref:ECF sigma factor n=1 Tax=Saltatorellus ferox TaxID=2528018 RepID=A0A518ESH5_9BACT|nr:ECF sigma factor [Planctomycetes bacterium Poly30]